jgi:hypothetical protein
MGILSLLGFVLALLGPSLAQGQALNPTSLPGYIGHKSAGNYAIIKVAPTAGENEAPLVVGANTPSPMDRATARAMAYLATARHALGLCTEEHIEAMPRINAEPGPDGKFYVNIQRTLEDAAVWDGTIGLRVGQAGVEEIILSSTITCTPAMVDALRRRTVRPDQAIEDARKAFPTPNPHSWTAIAATGRQPTVQLYVSNDADLVWYAVQLPGYSLVLPLPSQGRG